MMEEKPSKSAIDRLGEVLRTKPLDAASLQELDAYRRPFEGAYDSVVAVLRDQLGLSPTGRHGKSTTAIIDKLQRETIRLSQMQDIAGCRVVVADASVQDRVVDEISRAFDRFSVVDRRKAPSHGYRAVHIIVYADQRAVEIQVRTELQHSWAELSEKLSDRISPGIKYGDGNETILSLLRAWSDRVSVIEEVERDILADRVYHSGETGPEAQDALGDLLAALASAKRDLRSVLDDLTRHLS